MNIALVFPKSTFLSVVNGILQKKILHTSNLLVLMWVINHSGTHKNKGAAVYNGGYLEWRDEEESA